MRIDEAVWDEWNEEHVAQHGLEPQEVEEAILDPARVVLRAKGSAESRRYIVLGLTDPGRYVFSVVELFGGGRVYVVTARDMTDGEKQRYKRR